MSNIGELVNGKEKTFAKMKLKNDTVSLLKFFSEFPTIQEYPDSKLIINQAAISVDNDVWEIKATIVGIVIYHDKIVSYIAPQK